MREQRIRLTTLGAMFAFMLFAMNVDSAAKTTGDVNLFLGKKLLNEDDWAPADDHKEIGVLVSLSDENWPFAFAIDLLRSSEEVFDGTTELSTIEIGIGLRKIWDRGKIRPFVGGGLGLVQGRVDVHGESVSDENAGAWIDGGVFLRLGGHFNLGVEARYSRAEIELLQQDIDAGGSHLGVLLGFGW